MEDWLKMELHLITISDVLLDCYCSIILLYFILFTFSSVIIWLLSMTFTVGGSENTNYFNSKISWLNSSEVATITSSSPITSPLLILAFTLLASFTSSVIK